MHSTAFGFLTLVDDKTGDGHLGEREASMGGEKILHQLRGRLLGDSCESDVRRIGPRFNRESQLAQHTAECRVKLDQAAARTDPRPEHARPAPLGKTPHTGNRQVKSLEGDAFHRIEQPQEVWL